MAGAAQRAPELSGVAGERLQVCSLSLPAYLPCLPRLLAACLPANCQSPAVTTPVSASACPPVHK